MLVSVIIPCYNVDNYIEECINSVYKQTHHNIEIICIDNNSTDQTWNVLLKLKENNHTLIIDKELKAGANSARNKGLTLSKGEWIQFLDADDLLEPFKIEHQLQLIQPTNQSIGYIAAASKKVSAQKTVTTVPNQNVDDLVAAFISQSGNTCSNLWNKKALIDVGTWNEDIRSSQETELMLRFALHHTKRIIDVLPLTIIRERESGQISQGNQENKWQQYIDIRIQYLTRLKNNNPDFYKKNEGIVYDFLMISVITLAKINLNMGLHYYNNYIKSNWNSAYQFGFSKLKVLFIKTVGLNYFLKFSSQK